MTMRRIAIASVLAGALLPAGATSAANAGAESGWPVATPTEAGFAVDLRERIDSALAGDGFAGLHAVVLIRGGKLVHERYLAGDDEIWGRRKQDVVFGPDSLHDVRSITKSVVGLLYGIALHEGIVPGLDEPIVTAFPEYEDLAADPARRGVTARHMLSMTMGLEWDEFTLPYSDPMNSEVAMNRAPDSLRYVLERPVVSEPGATWVYNGGATELAGVLIARGSGMGLAEYANSRLFERLGIDRFEWITDYYGNPYAASALRLRPRDTAKLGQLVLQGGAWNGTQVVPRDWIEASVARQAEAMEECGYGYQWWLCATAGGVDIVEGSGWGGQQLLIVPEHDIVLAVNAGLYGDPEAWRLGYGLLEDIILPALAKP